VLWCIPTLHVLWCIPTLTCVVVYPNTLREQGGELWCLPTLLQGARVTLWPRQLALAGKKSALRVGMMHIACESGCKHSMRVGYDESETSPDLM